MSTVLHDSRAPAFMPPHALAPAPRPLDEGPAPSVQPDRPAGFNFVEGLGWMVLIILVAQVIPAWAGAPLLRRMGVPPGQLFLAVLFLGQMVSLAVSVVALRLRLGRGWYAELGLNRLPPLPTLMAVLCMPGLKLVCGGVAVLATLVFGGTDPAGVVVTRAVADIPWWLCLLPIAVGPALNEELWCRGFLGRGLVGRYGLMAGMLLASLLFGVMHLAPIQATYAAVMGVGLHLAYRATRSLWVPVLMHGLFNASSVVLVALLSAYGPGQEAAAMPGPLVMVIAGVVSGVVGLALLALPGWGLWKWRVRES